MISTAQSIGVEYSKLLLGDYSTSATGLRISLTKLRRLGYSVTIEPRKKRGAPRV